MSPTHRDGLDGGVDRAWDDDADRQLPVVGGIGRVGGGASTVVEVDLNVDPGTQFLDQR